MMDLLMYGAKQARFHIPSRVLDMVFKVDTRYGNNFYNVDSAIIDKVLRPRILTDFNLLSNNMVIIPFTKLKILEHIKDMLVVEVPVSVSNGRKLISANSVVNSSANIVPDPQNMMLNNVAKYGAPLSSARITLLTHSVIRIEGIGDADISRLNLKCMLEYDEQLSAIQPRSFPDLVPFMLAAIKAYIYVELVLDIDEAVIRYGHEVPAVRNVVDKFESANEDYMELLPKVEKILFINDQPSMSNYIKNMMPNTF